MRNLCGPCFNRNHRQCEHGACECSTSACASARAQRRQTVHAELGQQYINSTWSQYKSRGEVNTDG